MDKLRHTKEQLENTKDKTVGKFVEVTGKLTDNQGIELAGKLRQATTEVKDRVYDVKEDVFQEGRRLMDHASAQLKGDNNNAGDK